MLVSMGAEDAGTTLVLGASGFLGAHVVAAAVVRARREATFLEPTGAPVLAISRDPDSAPHFCQPRDAADWHTLDLTEEGGLEEFMARQRPRIVWNCAAHSRVADCARSPDLAQQLNVEMPGRLAARCRESGARLVHVSTDLVFGAEEPPAGGFVEASPVGPLSVYGRTKVEGERQVLEQCPGAWVVRLPLLYGNSGGRGIGASDALLEAVDRDALPPLFVDEWRTPLEVSNAAQALVELGDTEGTGLLHVAGPERVSRYELGLAVLESMGLAPDLARDSVREARARDLPDLGPRPSDVSLDASRARELLSTELFGVRDGLQLAITSRAARS